MGTTFNAFPIDGIKPSELAGQTAAIADDSVMIVETAAGQVLYITGANVKLANRTDIHYLEFDETAVAPAWAEGRVYWDSTNHCLVQMNDSSAIRQQIGQEIYVRAYNDTGGQIDNGEVVHISGANTNAVEIVLADASSATLHATAGIATHDIPNGNYGYVTCYGMVGGLDTSAYAPGTTLYLSATTPGALTNTEPAYPNYSVNIATVVVQDASVGSLFVHPEHPPHRVGQSVCLSAFIAQNPRLTDTEIHGGFRKIQDAGAVSNGSPLAVTNGCGKLFINIVAGTDVSGTLTITGTKVDRNTGVETPATSENITITAVTTDNSSTDAQGNIIHSFVGGYITANWYIGAVTISTADLNITDMDVWNIAFEQMNDEADVTLNTVDGTFTCTNSAAWLYAYIYTVDVTTATKKCNITNRGATSVTAAQSVADRTYRRRAGNINYNFNGTHDGFFIDIHFGPSTQEYWINNTIKAWFTVTKHLEG